MNRGSIQQTPTPLTVRSKGSSRLHSWEVAVPGRESRPFHAKSMLFILYYQHCKKSVKTWPMSSKNLQYFVAGISQSLERRKPLFPQRTKTTVIKTRIQLSNYTILLSNIDLLMQTSQSLGPHVSSLFQRVEYREIRLRK